jgi:phage pi2 protein 07
MSEAPERHVRVTANECQAMRYLQSDGWSLGELSTAFGSDGDTVAEHVYGRCDHPDVESRLR